MNKLRYIITYYECLTHVKDRQSSSCGLHARVQHSITIVTPVGNSTGSLIILLKSGNEKGWHVARMGEKRNAYRILVSKPEGKRPLGRPRRRWVDNIKLDLREIRWDGMGWSGLAQVGEQ
jgi:hypothetical protein